VINLLYDSYAVFLGNNFGDKLQCSLAATEKT